MIVSVLFRNILLYGLVAFPVSTVSFSAFAESQDSEQTDTGQELPITPPAIKEEVRADYPERAFEESIEATVLLEVDIDVEGNVEGVSVLEPATPVGYGFDEAAVEAVTSFLFEPAKEGEVPIPVRITYRYNFTLDTVDPPVGDRTVVAEDTPDSSSTGESESQAEPVVNYRGLLLERGNRLPMAGVTVVAFSQSEGEESLAYETTTDSTGMFEFFDLKPGDWRVLAEPEGFYPLRTTESVGENQLIEASYFIERGQYNSYDILVEGDRERKVVSKTSFTVEEIEKVPGTNGDILAVVRNLPGVARPPTFGGSIIVRGSSPEDSEVFVDGVSVPIIYHFGGLRSVIPLGMLDRIDFYPGNFSSEYGRATGGIVDVGLKNLNPEKVGGYVDVNLFDSGVFLEAPLGDKVSIAVSARRSYIDGILNLAVPDDAPVSLLSAPRYYDYQVLASVRPSPKHDFKAFVFGSDDELKILFNDPANFSPEFTASNASTSIAFYRTLLQYRYSPSERFSNELQASGGRNWVFLGAGDQFFFDLNTYVGQVRDNMKLRLSDNLTLNTGFDYQLSKTDVEIKLPVTAKEGEDGGRPDFDTVRYTENKGEAYHSIAGYLEAEVSLFERLLLLPGVRYDYFSRMDDYSVAPRFNGRLSLTDQWLVKAGVGLYHQEPAFDETNEIFGNPNLGLEKAWHYSAGFEYKPLEHLVLDATFFYKDIQDLVSRTTETTQRDGEIVPLNFNNKGIGRVFGLELLLRHQFKNNFNGWLSYTLSRAERKDWGSNEWRRFDYDQTHILAAIGTYTLPRNWSIGFRFRLVSGNPDTPREGAVYVVDDGLYEPIKGAINSRRLPMFHQLDLRVDKRWIYDYWILTAYLDIQNVYDHGNVEGYTYNVDSTKRKPNEGLLIIPIIGVKGEF